MSATKEERNQLVIELREKNKLSFLQIAKKVGVGKQTVYDIYQREVKRRKGLSTG
jgi:DNA invertase Pin-like site-specific DNA recombinase